MAKIARLWSWCVEKNILVWLVWIFALYFLFYKVWSGSLFLWDEALSAERAREFWVTGDWLTPHFEYAPSFNKPPLYYWIVAILYKIIGMNELAVRLPSVCFAIGSLVLVQRVASRTAGTVSAGVWALLLLATNPHWTVLVRQGFLDSGMGLGMAMFLMYLTRRPTGRFDSIFAGIALGLACLLKSPLALGAVLPACVYLWLFERDKGWWKSMAIALGVTFVLAGSWYLAQYIRWGDAYVQQFIVSQHVAPISQATSRRARVWSYYLIRGLEYAPFTFYVTFFSLVAIAVHRKLAKGTAIWWLSAGFMFLALSAAQVKYHRYLVQLYPLAAIGAGVVIDRLLRKVRFRPISYGIGLALAVASLALFYPRYSHKMGDTSDEKRVSQWILKNRGQGCLILSHRVRVNAILYYSHGRVMKIDNPELTQYVHALAEGEGEPFVLICKKRNRREVLRLMNDLGPSVHLKHLTSRGHLVAYEAYLQNDQAESGSLVQAGQERIEIEEEE